MTIVDWIKDWILDFWWWFRYWAFNPMKFEYLIKWQDEEEAIQ